MNKFYLLPEYISDIVMRAIDEKQMPVLTPIIEKYNKLYKGQKLTGQIYLNYVNGVFKKYMEASKDGNV